MTVPRSRAGNAERASSGAASAVHIGPAQALVLGLALALVLALVLPLAGCSPVDEPRWISLSASPVTAARDAETTFEASDGHRWRRVVREDGAWLVADIVRDDWAFRPRVQQGAWISVLAVRGSERPKAGGAAQRLGAGPRALRHDAPDPLRDAWALNEGGFHAEPDRLVLKLAPGEEPPASMTLELFDGATLREEGRLRVRGRRFAGDGFELWPGQALELEVEVPPGSALRFSTAIEDVLTRVADGSEVVLSVTRDGETVFEERVPAGAQHLAAHVVPLLDLDGAQRRMRLTFRVDGAPARAAFLDPIVGPAQIGTYAARPWSDRHADVIVFLADTFRADNLRAYGGQLGVTPQLDALAEKSLVFRRAWSTSTFTLPAHATMFAGVHPYQAGIVGHGRGLPHAWTTLAEELTRAGFRTGAVTESVFVSQAYGMDQGFARWDEDRRPLQTTLERARAFLDADDGRPVFLFVHTYRTHVPYVVSEETRREHGARLKLAGDWDDVQRALAELADAPDAPGAEARMQELGSAAHALYRATAVDLDRGFATFHADLVARGLDRSGYLVFTSDHGEAFLEHGELFHPGPVWDELVRVPFFVAGRDVEPGIAKGPASLLDLAPTVCRLAGVEPRSEWLGRALLRGGRERSGEPSILMFECRPRERSTLAVVEGWRKTIGFEDARALAAREVLGAFDLSVDPREKHDLAGEPWPRAMLERNAASLERALEPAVGLEDATLDAGKVAELRGMGYTGD